MGEPKEQTVRYRYRVYLTRAQEQAADRLFGCCRVVRNDTITLFRERFDPAHRDNMPSQSQAQTMLLADAKKTPERAWLADVSNVALTQAFRDEWKACWDGVRKDRKQRFPRYRSKKRNPVNSARFTRNGFHVTARGVFVAKIGVLRTKWSRPMPSAPSSCTLIHEACGRWYVSLTVRRTVTPLPRAQVDAAIDMGLSDMAAIIDTSGKRWKMSNPRTYTRLQTKISRLQKHLSKQEKGSKRYGKTRRRIALLYAKAHDALDDYQNKQALRIVRETQAVGVETLNIRGMAKQHGKSMRDAAMRRFLDKLGAKAEQYGRTVTPIGRWEPTTRMCAVCKHKVSGGIPENVRRWVCARCGTLLDRDWNAAVNILDAAGLAESLNARGGSVRLALASAEESGSRGNANHPGGGNVSPEPGIPLLQHGEEVNIWIPDPYQPRFRKRRRV